MFEKVRVKSAHVRERGNVYWIDILTTARPPENRIRKSLDIKVSDPGAKAAAELALKAMTKQINEGSTPRVAAANGGTLTADWADDWIERRQKQGVWNWRSEAAHLKVHFLSFILVTGKRGGFADRLLGDITTGEMLDWAEGLRHHSKRMGSRPRDESKETIQRGTIENIQRTVRMFFDAAVQRELIARSPCNWTWRDWTPREDDLATLARQKDGRLARMELDEVNEILCSEKVPTDRRVLYALELFTGVRTQEAAARRWSDIIPAEPLNALMADTSWNDLDGVYKMTKTATVKIIPIHPELQRVLAWWKGAGWVQTYGRLPAADDLIVPTHHTTMRPRCSSESNSSWHLDLDRLGLRSRRHYETRAAFRTHAFAAVGAEGKVFIDLITHPPKGAKDRNYLYMGPLWQHVCAAVEKLPFKADAVKPYVFRHAGGRAARQPVSRITPTEEGTAAKGTIRGKLAGLAQG